MCVVSAKDNEKHMDFIDALRKIYEANPIKIQRLREDQELPEYLEDLEEFLQLKEFIKAIIAQKKIDTGELVRERVEDNYNYFITGFVDRDEDGHLNPFTTRTFGYYSDFETADHAVRVNMADIREYTYNYMLIEKIREGLYQYAVDVNSRWLYKYNEEDEEFEPVDIGNEFFGICGIAFG